MTILNLTFAPLSSADRQGLLGAAEDAMICYINPNLEDSDVYILEGKELIQVMMEDGFENHYTLEYLGPLQGFLAVPQPDQDHCIESFEVMINVPDIHLSSKVEPKISYRGGEYTLDQVVAMYEKKFQYLEQKDALKVLNQLLVIFKTP